MHLSSHLWFSLLRSSSSFFFVLLPFLHFSQPTAQIVVEFEDHAHYRILQRKDWMRVLDRKLIGKPQTQTQTQTQTKVCFVGFLLIDVDG
jgi:hypothetical protein